MSLTTGINRAYDARMTELAHQRRENEREYFGISQESLRNPPRKVAYQPPVSGSELREARAFNTLINYIRTVEPQNPNVRTPFAVRHAEDFRRQGPRQDAVQIEVTYHNEGSKTVVRKSVKGIIPAETKPDTQNPRAAIAEGLSDLLEEKHVELTMQQRKAEVAAEARQREEQQNLTDRLTAAINYLGVKDEDARQDLYLRGLEGSFVADVESIKAGKLPAHLRKLSRSTVKSAYVAAVTGNIRMPHTFAVAQYFGIPLYNSVVEAAPQARLFYLTDVVNDNRTPLPSKLRRKGEPALTGTEGGHLVEHAIEQASK